ncbi:MULTISPECIES: SDR family oxidoreductase [unclassified Sphingomonas]|uniref:SDR family oxidoreductase n=1 Tax=unclassified Sphingomonas TaxID=196159 RepID=UPI0006FD1A0E|nr:MULTISPECIES: SDR family oxidoreductase [unclassified Sphingomonas]KQX18330.1 short-chain dehydrogenase [Sphingomonas sp. Root1294]KQY72343.1 short-chain dehydrogenase [Sphingomonas sp. Root50]KRB94384.1 short-chain dehydrogenase [Sphingomonas sp. Root720]
MRAAVVTGASSGIGLATAALLVERGWQVFGSVRSSAAADKLAAAIGPGVTPLIFDLRDGEAIGRAAAEIATALDGRRLDGLVNNAGLAHFGPLALQPIEDWQAQIEVNLCGTLRVVQALLPLLGADPSRTGPPGRIVNISSVSGRIALPFTSGYAASKHGLEALSDAMRRELAIYGIRTVVVQPGAVRTPIWDKIDRAEDERFADSDFGPPFARFKAAFAAAGRAALPPERFAELIHRALTIRNPRPRQALMRGRLMHWTLPRLLGDRAVDRLIGRSLALTNKEPAA